MKRKKEALIASILFAVGAALWAVNVFRSLPRGGPVETLFLLQCGCVILFSVAAIKNFVEFWRSGAGEDDK